MNDDDGWINDVIDYINDIDEDTENVDYKDYYDDIDVIGDDKDGDIDEDDIVELWWWDR